MKKDKQKIEDPLRLYLIYNEDRSGGEKINPEEQWSNRTPMQITVEFKSFFRSQPDRFFYDSIEVDEETFTSDVVYLAVVRYSDGDTFGQSSGHWHIVGAYSTVKEADQKLKEALDGEGYKPWNGYFSSLEDTDVIPVIVRD